MGYKIKIYTTTEGKCPFEQWLNKLKDKKTEAIIWSRLERLEMGNVGHCESVGNGIHELKISFGPGYRIYFGKIGKFVVLLLCAGSKKQQQKDIDLAKKYFEKIKNRGETNDKKEKTNRRS